MPWPRPSAAILLLCLLAAARGAAAIDEIAVEESIADLLPQKFDPLQHDDDDDAATRRWAVLPQLGFGPDTGPVVGLKYTHRDIFDSGVTFDFNAAYALEKQQSIAISLEDPHILDGRFLYAIRARYSYDPQREFFGLGNNDQGPDPASTNSFQDAGGSLTFGWRPLRRLAVNFSVGLRDVHIADGTQKSVCGPLVPCPFTPEAFPDLPGVQGGTVNPFAISLVWNDRDGFVRPTNGWRGILKIIHTNTALLSDYEYTRYIADLGYLYAFDDEGRYVAGFRLDGEWVAGPDQDIPYWELAELGGDDTMRGFYPHRFVGKGRALLNLEFKFLIYEFDFFDIWHVKLDGVVFGDGGRVFLNATDVEEEFKLNEQIFERIVSDFRYSYGGGLRIALGEALVARIDVGFSDEETGLVYLAFGHTF